jgi:hypothetical protein
VGKIGVCGRPGILLSEYTTGGCQRQSLQRTQHRSSSCKGSSTPASQGTASFAQRDGARVAFCKSTIKLRTLFSSAQLGDTPKLSHSDYSLVVCVSGRPRTCSTPDGLSGKPKLFALDFLLCRLPMVSSAALSLPTRKLFEE